MHGGGCLIPQIPTSSSLAVYVPLGLWVPPDALGSGGRGAGRAGVGSNDEHKPDPSVAEGRTPALPETSACCDGHHGVTALPGHRAGGGTQPQQLDVVSNHVGFFPCFFNHMGFPVHGPWILAGSVLQRGWRATAGTGSGALHRNLPVLRRQLPWFSSCARMT